MSFTLRLYYRRLKKLPVLMEWSLGGFMGRSGEGNNQSLVLAIEPRFLLRPIIVVTIPTELSCLNNVKLVE
jgi:hypothetical protein